MDEETYRVLYGMQWIMFPSLPDVASSPPQRGGSNTKLKH